MEHNGTWPWPFLMNHDNLTWKLLNKSGTMTIEKKKKTLNMTIKSMTIDSVKNQCQKWGNYWIKVRILTFHIIQTLLKSYQLRRFLVERCGNWFQACWNDGCFSRTIFLLFCQWWNIIILIFVNEDISHGQYYWQN